MPEAVPSALGQTHLLIANQVLSRGSTFLLNLLVVRTVGPLVFGVQAINLYLLYTTILFLSREGFRRAALKSGPGTRVQEIVNLAWCCVPLGILTAGCGVWIGLHFGPGKELPDFPAALALYAVSALLELFSEPVQLLAQRRVLIRLRVRIETLATLLSCLGTFVCVQFLDLRLMAFAFGQLIFSFVILGSYYVGVVGGWLGPISLRQMFPGRVPPGQGWLEPELAKHSGSFTLQSLEKLLLTEGEKFVLATSTPTENRNDAGVYGLVHNLGSLVARLLFQPIEEASFMQFSRILSHTEARSGDTSLDDRTLQQKMSRKARRQWKALLLEAGPQVPVRQREQSLGLLALVLKAVLLIGCTACCFGPPFSFTFLHLAYGAVWSHTDAPVALSCFSVSPILLALRSCLVCPWFTPISCWSSPRCCFLRHSRPISSSWP